MKYKDLEDKDILFIRQTHLNNSMTWQERMNILVTRFETSERTIRKWIQKLGFSSFESTLSEQEEEARKRKVSDSKYYIITSAQNATPVHKPFFTNIEAYAKFLGADIHALIYRYKNPTSIFADKEEDWWATELSPYVSSARLALNRGLTLIGDLKIQPTATDPLSGLEGLTGDSTSIIGHPRVHLKTLPVLDGHKHKFMLTTGACTILNYTDSKAGKKGEFHHTFGFVIVEIKDKDTYYVRQVTASPDGSFYDLMNKVDGGVVSKIDNVEAYVMGDLHSSEKDEPLFESTLKYLDKLKPKNLMLHDIFSGKSISHHERKDPIKQYQKLQSGAAYLEKEIEVTLKDIETLLPYNPIVVRSNHDLWLDRWIVDQDWKKELHNSPQYLKYALVLLENKAEDGLFPYIVNERFGDNVKCLKLNDSFKVCGWELSNHGHMGSNGSRGSIEQFRKFNTKMITADSHCLPLEYQVQFKDRGWGEIKTVKEGDIILSYNPATGENEWNEVQAYFERDYKGLMLQIAGNGFEQTFTQDHMLMMSDGSYIPAHEAIVTRSASELPLSALPVKGDGVSIPEKIIRQIVAIAADGSLDSVENKRRVRFGLTKERKIERLYYLFGEDVVKYNTKEGFDGYIPVFSSSIQEILKYKSILTSKTLSNEVLTWDSESLEILQDELSYWDGTMDTQTNGRQWSSSNKRESNIVMSVLTRLGYSCSMSIRKRIDPNHKSNFVITWCVNRDRSRSTLAKTHTKRFGSWNFSSYNTEGVRVACLSVPNKCFWIRSDKTRQVSLTGNCAHRKDGAISVGTHSKARMGFNNGPSSWCNADAIIHENGKAQHLIFFNNEFTTLL